MMLGKMVEKKMDRKREITGSKQHKDDRKLSRDKNKKDWDVSAAY